MHLGGRIFGALALFAVLLASSGSQAQQSRGLSAVSVLDKNGAEVALYAESHALVIGVSKYTGGWPSLRGVKKDIPEVKAALEKQGFTVTTVTDPDRDGLDRAFREFIAKHGQAPNNRLLFYFAGHGHTMDLAYGGQMGYLVPKDAPDPDKDPSGFQATSMSMQTIEVYAKNIQSKHALFVFDACFSGGIFTTNRGIPPVISSKTDQPVRQFISSGTADQPVPDESIFRGQFVAALAGEADLNGDGYVTGAELGQFLEDQVSNYSRGAQTPQYGKLRDSLLDKGDFVFIMVGKAGGNQASAEAARLRRETEASQDEAARLRQENERLKAEVEAERLRQENERLKAEAARQQQQQVAVVTPPVRPAAGGSRSPGSVFRDCADCPEMVVVPAGSFDMGSNDGDSDEKPIHRVTIPQPFAVGKYEVTRGAFGAFVQATGYDAGNSCYVWDGKAWKDLPDRSWRNPGYSQTDKDPVACVNWNDADAYVKWLNGKIGGVATASSGGSGPYRLLTESEWEYAARAGTTTKWSCGSDEGCLNGAAWYFNNANNKTHPVGGKSANGFGLYDMHGNVLEWVADCHHDSYQGAPTNGSAVTTGDCSKRVLRGGSWDYDPRVLRSANRNGNTPGYRDDNLGFRLARTVLP